jgi:glutathione S-transferase
VEKHTAGLAKVLQGYKRILSKQTYLGGDDVTLADLSHLPYGSLASNVSDHTPISGRLTSADGFPRSASVQLSRMGRCPTSLDGGKAFKSIRLG